MNQIQNIVMASGYHADPSVGELYSGANSFENGTTVFACGKIPGTTKYNIGSLKNEDEYVFCILERSVELNDWAIPMKPLVTFGVGYLPSVRL